MKFFYKVDATNKYLELCDASGNTYYAGHEFNWTEIKFVLEESTWTLYVNGAWTKGGLSGDTLGELIPTVRWVGAKVFEKESVDAVLADAKELGFTRSAEGTPIA